MIKKPSLKIYSSFSTNIIPRLQTSNSSLTKEHARTKFPLTFRILSKFIPKISRFYTGNATTKGSRVLHPKTFIPKSIRIPAKKHDHPLPFSFSRCRFKNQFQPKEKKTHRQSHSLFFVPFDSNLPPLFSPETRSENRARERNGVTRREGTSDKFLEQVPPTNFSIPFLFLRTLQPPVRSKKQSLANVFFVTGCANVCVLNEFQLLFTNSLVLCFCAAPREKLGRGSS